MNYDAIRPDGPTIAIEHQATGEQAVHVTPEGIQPAKRTHADLVRNMTDEQLATLFSNTEGNFPPNYPNGVSVSLCRAAWLEWLKAEAE